MTQDDLALRPAGTPTTPGIPGDPGAGTPAPNSSGDGTVGRAVREVVETLLLAAIIFLGVRLVVLNFRVDGASMVPNLANEEMLLVNRNAYLNFDTSGLLALLPGEDGPGPHVFYPFSPPERGDIVVFDPPPSEVSDKPYIKRVIGLPGDRVTFGDGQVRVNDVAVDEPYIPDETRCSERRQEYCDYLVQPGEVFLLGDNRSSSQDSREFGPVPVENVIGKAWLGYWPPSAIGFVPHYDYPGIPEGEALGADAAEADGLPAASTIPPEDGAAAAGADADAGAGEDGRDDRATRRNGRDRDALASPPAS